MASRHMPSLWVQPPTDVLDNHHGWNIKLLQDHQWKGKEQFASTSNRLPLMYHRGTWLGMMGYRYDTVDPGEFPYPLNEGLHATPITRQYGKTPFGKKGSIIRAPVTILYNGTLKVTGVSPHTDDFDYVDGLIDAKKERLGKHNVFTASVYDFFVPSFLSGLFPITTFNTSSDFTIDETTFLGGHLLWLCGFDINTANEYFDQDGGFHATAVSRDLGFLGKALKRFLTYKVIVYGRYVGTTPLVGQLVNYFVQLKSMAATYRDNLTIRGPLLASDDLGPNLQADVDEFLTSLE